MCFSAVASFTAAGLLMVLGFISLSLIHRRAKPSTTIVQKRALTTLAALPLLFGFHQFSEGMVWLDPTNQSAIRLFLYTAYTFWPLYTSLSLALIEWTRKAHISLPVERDCRLCHCCASGPPPVRHVFYSKARRWLLVCNVFLSCVLFGVLTACLAESEPVSVDTSDGRLDYSTCSWPEGLAYVGLLVYTFTLIGSFLLSSLRYSSFLGFMGLIALIVTIMLWIDQFESTWCFFAALLSTMVVWVVWVELEAYPVGEESDPNDNDDGDNGNDNDLPSENKFDQEIKTSKEGKGKDGSDEV